MTAAVTAVLQRLPVKPRLRHSAKPRLPRLLGAVLMTWTTTFRFDEKRPVWSSAPPE
jgi:hypothetical protein